MMSSQASDTKGPARRATIQLYEADSSEPVETTTFVEKSPRTGELVLETDNDIVVWFYSAQAKGAYVKISIEANYNGKFQYLNTMKPLTVCLPLPYCVQQGRLLSICRTIPWCRSVAMLLI